MTDPSAPRAWAALLLLSLLVGGCAGRASPPTATPPVLVERPTEAATATSTDATRPTASSGVPSPTAAPSTTVAAPPSATSPASTATAATGTPSVEPPFPTSAPSATGAPTLSPTAAPTAAPAGASDAEQRAVLHPQIAVPDLAAMPRYRVVATLDPPRLSGTMVLTVPNAGPEPLPDIVLRLYANAPTIYTGSRMTVWGVESDVGEPLDATVEGAGTALRVRLAAPVPPGGEATIRLGFELRVPDGSLQGYGIQQRHAGRTLMGSPFPLLALRDGALWRVPSVPAVGDAASSPVGLWDITLTVPADGYLAATGERLPTAAGAPLRLVSGPARDVALAWLPGAPIEREVAGVRLRYWPAPLDAPTLSAEGAADVAAAIVEAHAAEFGPPPYAELDVVEARVPIGGYEYPGLVILDTVQRQSGGRESIEFLLAHEIAHQWFYALLGNDVTAEPWLDESLATYAHLRYLARTRGDEAARAQRAAWEAEYERDLVRQPVGVNRDLFGYADWRDYRGPTYYGGAILLDELRLRLGGVAFRAALDALIAAHGFGEMRTADLRAAFDAQAAARGVTLDDLWVRWLED